jgi:hypothetical protein
MIKEAPIKHENSLISTYLPNQSHQSTSHHSTVKKQSVIHMPVIQEHHVATVPIRVQSHHSIANVPQHQ